MDDKRASTLEALQKFIQNQKTLLQQTQEDIAKLRELKSYVLSKPSVDPEDLLNQIHQVGDIHDPSYYKLVIPKEIDWDVFAGCDPAPMHALTIAVQEKYAERTRPSTTQTSPLSDLQRLVQEARRTIIDPTLKRCAAYMAQFPADDDVGEEQEKGINKQRKEYWKIEMEREREKEKIRQLKKRKIHAGLSLPGMSGGAAAVFVRRDVEDESVEVDVLSDSGDAVVKEEREMEDLGNTTGVRAENRLTKLKPSRVRKATAKQQQREEEKIMVQNSRKRKSASRSTATPTPTPAPASFEDLGSPMDVDDAYSNGNITTNGKRGTKPRSETYKQAWSESEQNLLEQLLEKIPEGEKNRWQKISKAMNGRRTPRQVASRVQKYFEKLKKFGVDVGKAYGKG
ncbi:hypothetical protein M378DRAFT_12877 [Amanita muscaria Koide BX008]|uniref:Uncharacterized protein n=1 Tax=Amanita muscaria (strain Koide BX008) TaxID=946122 RepID=A0A0C2SH26_AMAMK|nr:hypothetical protein M378DRAFT_12877 [Amanita muscaria Koide BX008]